MTTFKELGLSDAFVDNLKRLSITEPTEVQEKAIPLILQGDDIIGGSATGSGKTLAFAVSILEKIKPNQHVQALIMTPTRELAEQITESLNEFKTRDLNILAVYGGVDIEKQIRKMGTTDIVVGTPGRIQDHINRRTLRLDHVKYLVLDEVDRMFDMGFLEDVERILSVVPKKRQTMLFSATISEDVRYLARKHAHAPKEVAVKSYIDPAQLKQVFYDVPDNMKFSLLVHLLKKEKSHLVIVFCSTRNNVDFVTNNLLLQNISCKAIHGGMDQNKRNKALESFHKKEVNILVCTDVAARGLDIKGVSHVYNYDLPKTSEEYIHRIGRTARAGKEGIAISILASRDYENFNNIQTDEKLNITRLERPYLQRIDTQVPEKMRRRGPSRGRDPSRGRPQRSSGGFSRGNPEGRRDQPKRRFGQKTFDRDKPRGGSFKKRPSGKGSRRNLRGGRQGKR